MEGWRKRISRIASSFEAANKDAAALQQQRKLQAAQGAEVSSAASNSGARSASSSGGRSVSGKAAEPSGSSQQVLHSSNPTIWPHTCQELCWGPQSCMHRTIIMLASWLQLTNAPLLALAGEGECQITRRTSVQPAQRVDQLRGSCRREPRRRTQQPSDSCC